MDEDIQEDLKPISKNVQDIGRMIGSPKTDVRTLEDLSGALKLSAETLAAYVRIQKNRYLYDEREPNV
jgi:hypothetical protein